MSDQPKKQELPPLEGDRRRGVDLFEKRFGLNWNAFAYPVGQITPHGSECLDAVVEMAKCLHDLQERERQLLAALSDNEALRAELRHHESRPFYTRNLFENDGELAHKDWSQVTEEDFRSLFEYTGDCQCQGCAEIRYILSLRADNEAKDARIAELSEQYGIILDTLKAAEAKLKSVEGLLEEYEKEHWLPERLSKVFARIREAIK
jgi:hypothetical protein